ncbi:MAG: BamA/TamA family outer membrane protein [Gemmatimonadetes bacterium]|nr:BamA/TamA family outer membrane protein [Gemmatimonadota bacterium]
MPPQKKHWTRAVPVAAAALTLVLMAAAAPVFAQRGARAAPDDPCPDGRISFVFVDNNSIFDTSDPDLDARFRWAYSVANALHIRTRAWVIRRELLFAAGDCYDPFLLAESERLLRTYPFLSQVDIYGVPQPDSSHHVIVDTRDDWSTRVDIRFRIDNGVHLDGVRISELNLLGTGQAIGFFFFERDVRRDYGLSYWTPQIGRTRWDLSTSVGRTRAGSLFREEVGYPFVGEVGRWAGSQAYSREDRFFDYIVRDEPHEAVDRVLVPLRAKEFDASVLHRIGDRSSMWLVGLGLGYRALHYPGDIEVAPRGDFDARELADSAAAAAVRPQLSERDAVRVSLLAGRRDIRWIVRRGLDSMRGEEDVLLGTELGIAVGPSLPGSTDEDVAFAALLYAAARPANALLALRARFDALRVRGAPAAIEPWQDLWAEAEAYGYWRLDESARHLFVLRATVQSGWNTRTPFQLTLGGERGVRGYSLERFPGGRRLVMNGEDRIYIGWPLRDVMDVGATIFADAGRIWPGDAPFGADSGWRASAGLGLRVSFPADSRTTYRFDFAWPLERGAGLGDFRVRFSIGELIGLTGRDNDQQFRRSRPDAVAGNLFRHSGSRRS